jgi:hypothetical protein
MSFQMKRPEDEIWCNPSRNKAAKYFSPNSTRLRFVIPQVLELNDNIIAANAASSNHRKVCSMSETHEDVTAAGRTTSSDVDNTSVTDVQFRTNLVLLRLSEAELQRLQS